ncbi:hypothetical protein AAMO2058_000664500 [Amorphochlora amoebiformis]
MSAKNSLDMHVNRSTTRTHHHMSTHHSKSNWSIGGGSENKVSSNRVWNKKSRCWENRAQKPVTAKIGASAKNKTISKPIQRKPMAEENKKVVVPEAKPVKPTQSTKPTRVSSNAFASNTRPEYGNFITDRPTTRVHAPPGGRSQIQFG